MADSSSSFAAQLEAQSRVSPPEFAFAEQAPAHNDARFSTEHPEPVGGSRDHIRTSDVQDTEWLNPEPDKSDNAEIWQIYVEEANKSDLELLAKWNEGIDVFLLFTGLFSAILSAFLVAAWPTMQPDSSQGQSDALVVISQQLVLLSSGRPMDSSVAYQPQGFTPPGWAVGVNCLWFTSLFISLLTAVLAMLLKEWLTAYKDNVTLVPLERVKQRQMRYDGMIKWNVPSIVSLLPLAIHVAVFLFLIGLVLFAWPVSTALFTLLTMLLFGGLGLYIVLAALPMVHPECPYKSPMGTVFERVLRPL
ncbi:hypothetical protein CALVIDRAFT_511485, partial [Calocera viscosa TUFC12733]